MNNTIFKTVCQTIRKQAFRTLIIVGFLTINTNLFAQDHTLSNSSFEYYSGIPSHHSMFNNCVKVWENALPISVSTPDFYLKSASCNFTSWQTVYESVKVKTPNQFHGCGFAGIFLNYNNHINSPKFKEYFLQKIDLEVGHRYTVAIDIAKSSDTTSDNLEFDLGIYGYNGSIPASNINYCVTQADGSLAPLLARISKDSISYDLRRFYVSFTPTHNASYIMFGGTGCGIDAASNGYVFIDNIMMTDSLETILNPKVEYLSGETRGCCYSKNKEDFQLIGNLPQTTSTRIYWQQNRSNPELVTFTNDTNHITNITGSGLFIPGLYEFYYSFNNGTETATDTFKIQINPPFAINAGVNLVRLSTSSLPATHPNYNPMCGNNAFTMNATPNYTTINENQYLSWWSMLRSDGSEWVFPNYAVPYDGLNEGTVYVEDNMLYLGTPSITNNQGTLLTPSFKYKNPGYHPNNIFWVANAQDSIKMIWHIKDLCENIYTDTVLLVQNKVELVAPASRCIGDTVIVYQYNDAFFRKLQHHASLRYLWTNPKGNITYLNSVTRNDSIIFVINSDSLVNIRLTVTDSASGVVFYCQKSIIVKLDNFSAGPNQVRLNSECARVDFKMEAKPLLTDINTREYQSWWSMVRNDGTEWVFPNYCRPYNGLDEGTVYVDSNRYFDAPPTLTCEQGMLDANGLAYKNPGWHPNNSFTLRNPQDSVLFIWHIKDKCDNVYMDSVLVVQNRVNITAENTCNDNVVINGGDSILFHQVLDDRFYSVTPRRGLGFLWSRESGPGSVNFLRPLTNVDSMMVQFTTPGEYAIRLSVFDSIKNISFSCDKNIFVKIAPNANAGNDQIICNDTSAAIFTFNATANINEINNNCFQTWWSMIRDNGTEWVFPNYCVPFNGLNEGSVIMEMGRYFTPIPTMTCNQRKLNSAINSYKNPGWHPNNKVTFLDYGAKKFMWHVKDATTGIVSIDTVILSWSFDESIIQTMNDVHPLCNTTLLAGELSGASGGIGMDYRWRQLDGPMYLETSDTNRNGLYIYNLDHAAIGTYQFEYRKGKNSCFAYDTVAVIIDSHIVSTATILLSTDYDGSNLCYGDTVTISATGGVQYAFLVNGRTIQDFSSLNTFTYANFTDTSIVDVISLMSSDGCYSRGINPININVNFVEVPNILTASNNICVGESIALIASCATSTKMKWFTSRNIATATPINGPLYTSSIDTFMVNPTATTTYYVIAFDSITGCTSTIDSIKINVNPIPTVTSTARPNTFCAPGGICTLIGRCTQANTIIKWYNNPYGTGTPLNIDGTAPAAAFDYYFSHTDTVYAFAENIITGCISNFSKQIIRVNTPPTLSAFAADTMHVCEGNSITLSPTLVPTIATSNIRWYADSISSTRLITTRLSYSFIPTSNFLLYAIPTLGTCVGLNFDSIYINVHANPINPPAIHASDDTICRDELVNLSIDSLPTNCIAVWYNRSISIDTGSSIFVSPAISTTYTVYFVDMLTGCKSRLASNKLILVNQKPVAGTDKNICQYTSVNMNTTGTGIWSANRSNPSTCTYSSISAANAILSGFNISGAYEFYWTNNSGCSDSIIINVRAKPDAGSDLAICTGEVPLLTNGIGISGIWSSLASNPSGASTTRIDSNSIQVRFTPSASGIYKYYITSNTCRDTISISVLPKINAGADKHIKCYLTDSIQMSAIGVGTWSIASSSAGIATISNTNAANTFIKNFSVTGNYYLIWSNSNCEDTTMISVADSCYPAVINNHINQPIDNICYTAESIIITGDTAIPMTGNYQWLMNSGSGFSTALGISNQVNYTYNITSTGTYQFKRVYTTTSGYLLSDTSNIITINIHSADTISIHESICAGTLGQFSMIDYTHSANYTFHYSNSIGCDSTLYVQVEVLALDTNNIYITSCTPMLINNQSIFTSGVYTDTSSNLNGCDSFNIYHTTFIHTDTAFIHATACDNIGYIFNSRLLTSTGIYTDSFPSINGCDSFVVLDLIMHRASFHQLDYTMCHGEIFTYGLHSYTEEGIYIDSNVTINGCDSITTITLNVLPIADSSLFFTSCENEAITFNSIVYTTSGIYTDTFISNNGCDSIVTLHITILETDTTILRIDACNNVGYFFNDQLLTSTGIYTDTFSSSIGCDSFIILNLIIHTPSFRQVSYTICQGETLTFGSHTYTEEGIYLDSNTTSSGCDSITSITLNTLPTADSNLYFTACAGHSIQFNTTTYSYSGIYTDTFTSLNGCDSVIHLHITILEQDTSVIHLTSCTALNIGTQYINHSGRYYDTLYNSSGCDSVIIYQVSILENDTHFISANICNKDAYYFNNQYLLIAGTYQDTLTSINGCDSIIVLSLNVTNPIYVQLSETICSNEVYHLGNRNYSTDGIYIDTTIGINGCDSFTYVTLSVLASLDSNISITACAGESITYNNQVYTISGEYSQVFTSVNGCDSSIHIRINILPLITSYSSYYICHGTSIRTGSNIHDSPGIYFDTMQSHTGCDSVIQTSIYILSVSTESTYETVCAGTIINGIELYNDTILSDTLYTINHCDSIYHIANIHVNTLPPLEITGDTNICIGNEVDLTASGASSMFIWVRVYESDTAGLEVEDTLYLGSHFVFTPFESINLKVYSYNCISKLIYMPIGIHIYNMPNIEIANNDTCLYPGQKVLLSALHENGILSWSSIQGILCNNCETILIPAQFENIYFASIKDTFGCVALDTFHLCIKSECNDSTIEIPNLITSNEDGINDFFSIKNPENIPIVYTRIYDRWGMLLYSTSEQQPKWDGTVNGVKCSSGVYAYVIEARCQYRTNIVKSGNISVIK
ncbi:MAG: gliding motility-associated C-terminal domain-containing protein [Bacteroidota bacterium]